MYRKYHHPPKTNPTGKWERRPHTGVSQAASERVGDWSVEVSHRTVGTILKRQQFSVLIRREAPCHEETLHGFKTRQAAVAAAQKRIDLLQHIRALQPRHIRFDMTPPASP